MTDTLRPPPLPPRAPREGPAPPPDETPAQEDAELRRQLARLAARSLMLVVLAAVLLKFGVVRHNSELLTVLGVAYVIWFLSVPGILRRLEESAWLDWYYRGWHLP
jgi:hypothetical protein